MRPIPISLLVHDAELYSPIRDSYGNETDGEPTALHRVWMDPSSKMTIEKNGMQTQCTLVLMLDMRNTLPRGTVPAVGQIVRWNGARYRVLLVEQMFDGRRLHHVECGLTEAEA